MELENYSRSVDMSLFSHHNRTGNSFVTFKEKSMRSLLLCVGLFFSITGQAQKETVNKKVDTKLVNQKLVKLQSTVKKLETTLSEANKLMKDIHDQKKSLSEMNQEDMLWLQKLMEQKSQLEQMISNVMKAASEAQNNIAKNLKAS